MTPLKPDEDGVEPAEPHRAIGGWHVWTENVEIPLWLFMLFLGSVLGHIGIAFSIWFT